MSFYHDGKMVEPSIGVARDSMESSTLLSQPVNLDDAALAAMLSAQGVRHLLMAESAPDYTVLDQASLIGRLAGSTDARLREALMPLFLRHPEAAEHTPGLVQRLTPAAADTLRHFYTAAVYLQRFWLSTLRMHLGAFPLLPDYFGQSHYHLPPPDEKFGEAGLRSLARLYGAATGMDWLSVYNSSMSLFLQQLDLEQMYNGRIVG